MNAAVALDAERMSAPDQDERLVVVPQGITTLAKFRKWARSGSFPENGRIAWVQGEIIIDMSPERIFAHNQVKSEIFFALKALSKRLDLGMIFSDGVRLVHSKADVSSQPDLLFVAWETLNDRRVKIDLRAEDGKDDVEIVGSPDMVLEVVSPSSFRKDSVLMPDRYFRAGIKEYWLADARKNGVSLRIWRRGANGFEPASPADAWQASSVFGRYFRLVRGRNRANLWSFELRSRAL